MMYTAPQSLNQFFTKMVFIKNRCIFAVIFARIFAHIGQYGASKLI